MRSPIAAKSPNQMDLLHLQHSLSGARADPSPWKAACLSNQGSLSERFVRHLDYLFVSRLGHQTFNLSQPQSHHLLGAKPSIKNLAIPYMPLLRSFIFSWRVLSYRLGSGPGLFIEWEAILLVLAYRRYELLPIHCICGNCRLLGQDSAGKHLC